MLGYMCAYLRYYHPAEFITSYLNNAANENDIKMGTTYAKKVGIQVTMPKWGVSKGEYFFDKTGTRIAKGLSSVKYMGEKVADELYELSENNNYTSFMEVLQGIYQHTSVNTAQLEILINIDFFSDFGNQRELLEIVNLFYNMYKCGEAKKINKDKVDGTEIGYIISEYSTGLTKAGQEAKQYTITDMQGLLKASEEYVMKANLPDLEDITKVRNFKKAMGYVGYVSGKEEDYRKFYVLDVYELKRKKDQKQFGYSVVCMSLGTGKESRFTVFNRVFEKDPLKEDDIFYCDAYTVEGIYFTLTAYHKI